jgi:phosphoribosylpyrophosphate synthetase
MSETEKSCGIARIKTFNSERFRLTLNGSNELFHVNNDVLLKHGLSNAQSLEGKKVTLIHYKNPTYRPYVVDIIVDKHTVSKEKEKIRKKNEKIYVVTPKKKIERLKEKDQCRIFRNLERNKMIDSDSEKIITLGNYYPKYDRPYEDMDEFSNMILGIKKDESRIDNKSEYHYFEEAISYFTHKLEPVLSDKEGYVICVMPNHTVGINSSGMGIMAKQLCSSPVVDGTDVLSRVFKIPKKSIGGIRDDQREIDSITVKNASIVKDRQVLLLDDVTTTGTSLRAGKYLIKRAGAALVAMFALGKTPKG